MTSHPTAPVGGLRRFYDRLCRVELTLAMSTLVASTLLIFLAAVMRSIGAPMNWSMEMSLFLFAWSVFLSADVGLREDRLVNLDIFVNMLPPRLRVALNIVSYSLILVFLAALMVFGFYLSYRTRVRTFQGIPGFSYTWVTLSLPVASLLMLVTATHKLRGFIGKFRQL